MEFNLSEKWSRLPLEIIKWTAISLIVYLVFGLLLDNWDRLIIRGIHALWFVIATIVLILGGLIFFLERKKRKLKQLKEV